MTTSLHDRWLAASPLRRAIFSGTLATGMGLATLTAPVVSVFGPYLVTDLGLTRTELGAVTTIFAGVGALASPIAGKVADLWGGRRLLVLQWVLAVGLLWLVAASRSFAWMVLVAVVAGVGQAGCNPSTNRVLAHSVPVGARGIPMGLKQSGVFLGYIVGGLLMGPLAAAVGWRPTLVLSGFVVLALVWLPFAVFEPDHHDIRPAPASLADGGWRAYPPAVHLVTVYAFLMGCGTGAVIAYLPLYANEAIGWSVANAGLIATVFGVASVVARIGWSVGAERGERYGTALVVIAALAVMGTLSALFATPEAGGWLVVAAVLLGVSALAWNGVGLLAIIALVVPERVGRASGFMMIGWLAGFTLSPLLFGLLADRFDSYHASWLVLAGFHAAALATILSGVSTLQPSRP